MNCSKCRAPLEPHEVTGTTTVDACPKCFGVFYDKGELAAPLKLEKVSDSGLGCPRCAQRMTVCQSDGGKLVVDHCSGCGGIWFDMGEIQTLRKLSGVEQVAAGGPPPSETKAAVPADAPAGGKPKGSSGKPPAPPDMSTESNPDADGNPVVIHDGLRFAHFQTSVPVTTHVLGEFPWLAAAGDRARARDFIAPPYMLSNEVSAGESVWSRGEYVTPEEVWAAFGPQDRQPPRPRGVAPAQPNFWQERLPAMQKTFLAAVATALALTMLGSEKQFFVAAFEFTGADTEKSRVSEVFEIPGRTSNVQVNMETNLDNHWAYANMTLINAETDEALDFGVEASYYHGVDDGESWSEGRPYATVYVPRVPPGRYYLRLEPETSQVNLNLRVRLVRDVTLVRLPLIVFVLLLLPLTYAWLRREVFENERGMESDHPRVVESDDWEDDE